MRITGDAVVLVPLTAADADELSGLLGEPELRAWLRADGLDALRARFAGWEARRSPDGLERWLNWAIRARSDGRALGWIQATVRGDEAVVGYATLPLEREAGVATDALVTLVDWLRDELGLESVTAEIAGDNIASARVAAAAGFTQTERRADDEAVWALPGDEAPPGDPPDAPLASQGMAVALDLDRVEVRLLHPLAAAPQRSRAGDAGYDLRAVEPFSLAPGERATVPTGIAIALPPGVAGLVVPRSGLAARHGLSVVNGPGLIDPNYRGEIRVVLVNLGDEPFAGGAGDRVAQLLLVPYLAPEIVAVTELPPSPDDRGELGFGSSGR